MVKPILQTYPVIYAESEEERAKLRPIGRNKERYQETIQGWHEVIKSADEQGFWGVATIEHHFWSEGYEVGPAPAIMDAYWAAITKNVRVGQLGYVMSIQNPIRVAEETAIIDHLTQGRSFVGFARGYQSRWTNVFGQHYGTTSTKSPTAAKNNDTAVGAGFAQSGFTISDKDVANDQHNRDVFEENIEIVLKAWTQDSMQHKGSAWQIPFPGDTGVDDWQLAQVGVTQRLGALDEVDENNNVVNVSVCPAPYQDPHPPVFVSGSGSPETIEYAAKMGFIPTYFTNIDTLAPLGHQYADSAKSAGFNWLPGQNQNIVRWPHITKTSEDFDRKLRDYDLDIYKNFYGPFFPQFPQGNENELIQGMKDSDIFIGGTVDESIKAWKHIYDQVPCEYITLIWHWAQQPKDDMMEELQLFMDKVLPELETPEFEPVGQKFSMAAE